METILTELNDFFVASPKYKDIYGAPVTYSNTIALTPEFMDMLSKAIETNLLDNFIAEINELMEAHLSEETSTQTIEFIEV